MKKLITAVALTLLMTGSAFANSCPTHVKKIDAVLAAPPATISAENVAKAKALRDEGEALHEAGNHAESMEKLAEAEKLLGIGM
ncbi:MAG TPA: hypothetical protein VFE34_09980 [Dongiaceae bacterium]|jgi:hypothetical protein|nr:hypothetical protein [Dongiaceae bacterium]